MIAQIELLRNMIAIHFGCTKPGGRPLSGNRLENLKAKKGATCAVKRKTGKQKGELMYYRTGKGRSIEDKAKATRKKKRAAKRTRLQKLREKVAKRKKEGTYIGRVRAKPKAEKKPVKSGLEMRRETRDVYKKMKILAKKGSLGPEFNKLAKNLQSIGQEWKAATGEDTSEQTMTRIQMATEMGMEVRKEKEKEKKEKELKQKLLPIEGTEYTIDNEYAAGTSYYGWGHKFTVLQGQKTSDGGINLDYSGGPGNYNRGKLNQYESKIKGIGAVTSGYSKRDTDFYEQDAFEDASYVYGKTFEIKDDLKEKGFKWNRDKKRWEKPK